MSTKTRNFAHNRLTKNPNSTYKGSKGSTFKEEKKKESNVIEEKEEIYPLGISGNFLSDKEDTVRDIIEDLLQIRNIDKMPLKNSFIEIEVRLLGVKSERASDKFNRSLAWLKNKFPNVKEENFQETRYDIQNMADYTVNVIFRNNIGNLKFKKKGKDIIPLATVGNIAPILGISLESDLSIQYDLLHLNPIVRKRTRWSFPIDNTIHILLGLQQAVTRYNMSLSKIQSTFPIPDPVKARIDLTKSEDIKTGNIEYSIEIELDSKEIKELNQSQINLLDTWIKIFSVIINRTGTFLTTLDLESISIRVNNLVPISKDIKRNTMIPRILLNKPKDLQKRDVSWLDPTTSTLFMNLSNYDDQKDIQYNTLKKNKLYFPLFAIDGGYHISLKANGERYLLFFDVDGIYLLNPLSNIITKISGTKTIYPDAKDILTGTLFDCELITKTDMTGISEDYKILVFDILALEGKDIRNLKFTERLEKIEYAIKELYDITTKIGPKNPDGNKTIPFLTLALKPATKLIDPPNKELKIINETTYNLLCKKNADVFFQQIAEQIKSSKLEQTTVALNGKVIKWDTDGNIFTPSTRPYLENTNTFQQKVKHQNFSLVRKLKFNLTIDFYVTKTNEGISIQSYFVPSYRERGARKDNSHVPFQGSRFYPWNGNFEFNESMLDKIYEFEWKWSEVFLDYAFIPIRERQDRDVANELEVAQEVWDLINDPITEDDITGKNLSFMRRYHNKAKTAMLKDLASKFDSPILLDFGSGQGGDQNKWDGFENVYAVEPDEMNLRAFISRLENRNEISETIISDVENNLSAHYSRASAFHSRSVIKEKWRKIEIINAKVEDMEILENRIPMGKINCCTMFNALTFFYENLEKLNILINTIKAFLVEGGYFYCIALDGELLLNSMKIPGTTDIYNTIKTKNLTIRRAEDKSCRKIFIKIEGGIVRGQFEYLINTEEFVNLMSDNGFKLMESSYLNEETLLSTEEYWFSSMFKIMKFRYFTKPKIFGQGLKFMESKIEISNFSKILIEKMNGDRILKALSPTQDPQEIRSTKLRSVGRLIRIGTPQDGSCYIHGVVGAFSGSYRALSTPERQASMVQLRGDMSNNYTQEIHDSIGDGFFKGSENPAYSYANMKEALARTTFWITQELMEFIGDQLDTNVYILRGIDAEPYKFGYANSHIKSGRKNIVLYLINDNHYETVGLMEDENTARTVFADNHPLIVEIRKYI